LPIGPTAQRRTPARANDPGDNRHRGPTQCVEVPRGGDLNRRDEPAEEQSHPSRRASQPTFPVQIVLYVAQQIVDLCHAMLASWSRKNGLNGPSYF
jgi:hypothetical protein